MDNIFTSRGLLCHLQKQSIAATGTVRFCRMRSPPLKSVKEFEKLQRGTSVVAIETPYNISAVRWKNHKVVSVLSTFAGKEPPKSNDTVKGKKRSTFCSQTWSMFTTALWVGLIV